MDLAVAALLALVPLTPVPRFAPPPAGPAGPASIWYDPPLAGLDAPGAKAYADEAERLSSQGLDLAGVFAGLCRRLSGDGRLARRPRAAVADLFRGLIVWTRRGGRPSLHGRTDWPLHFAYGGLLGAAGGFAAAEAAGYAKEERDALTAGESFDLDDYAVTLIGGGWAQTAAEGSAEARRWVEDWASGRRSLAAGPAPAFGPLPPRRLPSATQIRAARDYARARLAGR